MKPADKARVLAALIGHRGRANGITARTLAQQIEISERDVRHAVTELREEEFAICGHPSSGYFIAETAAEIEETCEFLRGRALHSLMLASRLSKKPLAELIGQLRLKT